MRSPFFAVVKKELVSVLRDRTIIISILIQLFIASFSSALLLGMLSFYDADTIMRFSGAGFTLGVVTSPDDTLGRLLEDRGLTVLRYSSLTEAEAAFYEGKVLAFIDAPQPLNGLTEIKLYLPESETISSLIRMVIQEPLKQYENYLRLQKGVEVHYAGLKGKPSTAYEFIYSVLLPMLMFFPAFVSGSMSVDSLTEEVENKTLPTLLSAPLSINAMIGGKITASVILSVAQSVAWITLLRLNGIAIENTGWILVLATIVAGITSALAALGAVMLQDRERSQFIYSLMLLAATGISTLLNISPITTLSRLAIGDAYTNGWNVMVFGVFLVGLYFLLTKMSKRLLV